jgi:hypothetical protein
MMKRIWLQLAAVFFFSAVVFVFAQEEGGDDQYDYSAYDPYENSVGEMFIPEPPRSYRTVSLGMELESLKEALIADEFYQFRGDRDVSFLPLSNEDLIETFGTSFVQHAAFQLREEKLYIFTLKLNTRLVDHYSVFTTFVERYGQPNYLDPQEAVWESDTTRVSIERPLTVKYIDKDLFNDMLFNSRVVESREVQQREEFLNGF